MILSGKQNDFSVDEAWKALIDRYNIAEYIEKHVVFHITASQIKEFKEPRLMAKWDSASSLPESLKSRKINILCARGCEAGFIMADL